MLIQIQIYHLTEAMFLLFLFHRKVLNKFTPHKHLKSEQGVQLK